jgi:hypothetical protein
MSWQLESGIPRSVTLRSAALRLRQLRLALEPVITLPDAEIGDGAEDSALIPDLTAPIRASTRDFVIGSRVRGDREPDSMAWHQVVA